MRIIQYLCLTSCVILSLIGCTVKGDGTTTESSTAIQGPQEPRSDSSAGEIPQEKISEDVRIRQVLEKLQQQGMILEFAGTSQAIFLAPTPGVTYRFGGAHEWLHIHFFPDPSAAQIRAKYITNEVNMGKVEVDWAAPPHFYQCDNLIILYLGQNEHILRTLTENCGQEFAAGA